VRYTVVHEGVPVGAVELPEGRRWAGGLLEPLPAFEALRPLFAAAAGRLAATRLLALAAGEAPEVGDLPPDASEALRRAAALSFELRDAAGLPVAADVVRLADAGDRRGVIARAYFYHAGAPVPATLRPRPGGPGDETALSGRDDR
jgi:hypothetical protein